jgi:hypothetical protein
MLCQNNWENKPVCGLSGGNNWYGTNYQNPDSAKCAQSAIAHYGHCSMGFLDGLFLGNKIAGWVVDPDDKSRNVEVHVYVDGLPGQVNGYSILANTSRPDVGAAYPGYGNNHGFEFTIPAAYFNGNNHTFYVFAIKNGAYTNIQITNSPQTFLLQAPVTTPTPTPTPTATATATATPTATPTNSGQTTKSSTMPVVSTRAVQKNSGCAAGVVITDKNDSNGPGPMNILMTFLLLITPALVASVIKRNGLMLFIDIARRTP